MMAPLRQRYRLYDAENEACQPARWFGSAEAAQVWLDRQVRRKWWRKHCDIRHTKLVYPSHGVMSGARKEGDLLIIEVIPESLCVPTLVHELAHGLVWIPGNDPEKDHGRRFAGALIEAYRHFDSARTADDLVRAFEKRGVKWEPFG
jgi:hypothetical protein